MLKDQLCQLSWSIQVSIILNLLINLFSRWIVSVIIVIILINIIRSTMNPAQLIENRSVLTIFRDCLKLAGRMVDDPIKIIAVRTLIRQQFIKNQNIIDQQHIRVLKLAAARGISNYLIHTVKQQYNIRPERSIYDEEQGEQVLETAEDEGERTQEGQNR